MVNIRRTKYNDCKQCGKEVNTRVAIFCSLQCSTDFRVYERAKLGLLNGRYAKTYLLKEYGHKCWKCKNTEWNDQPIPLDLEHKDGNGENNSKENIELLCPNCHAQTPT